MYSKKIIVLTLIISMLLSIFVNYISLAAGNIEINMSKENDGSITLKVNAEKNISNISVYLKREGTEYKLFYRSNSVNSKNNTYKISRTRLSTQQETYFKVIVEDEEGTEKSKEFKGEKRTETTKPSTTPSESPKPSTSTNPTQSTKPSTSSSPTTTASTKPSTSPSTTPSQSPVQAEVQSISLNYNTLSLYVGNSKNIKATTKPSNAKTKITWSTSNSKVATVTSAGKITAVKAGTATITVKTTNGKTAQCKVTVKAKASNLMNIPKIYQTDSKYARYRFPVHTGSTMSGNGCGIVSTTMVLRYLTGKNIQVETVATWADRNGHFNGTGSNGSLFNAAAQKWNVGNAKYSKSITEVKQALLAGRPVILFCKRGSNALFTNNKHFVVLTGIDKNGKIHVNNPNKGKKEGAFTPAQIEDARVNYYIFDKKK